MIRAVFLGDMILLIQCHYDIFLSLLMHVVQGPIINHTGCARPHTVMNIVMSHMNLPYKISNSVECSTIMIFMTSCGRVVNYRSQKIPGPITRVLHCNLTRRSVSKRTAWSRGYSITMREELAQCQLEHSVPHLLTIINTAIESSCI